MVVVLFIVAGGNERSMAVAGFVVFGIGCSFAWGSASLNDLSGVVSVSAGVIRSQK